MRSASNAHAVRFRSLAALRVAGAGLLIAAWGSGAWAMPAPRPGVLETGAPSFVVLGPEAMGLSSNPGDLKLLPDGRLLVVSPDELAFGDGVRWESFRRAEGRTLLPLGAVAVDSEGQLYTGMPGGIGKIDLVEGSRWNLTQVTPTPESRDNTAVSVEMFPGAWYWYGGNGNIISWRPSETARMVGKAGAVQRLFKLGADIYASDQSSGGLYRLKGDGTSESVLPGNSLVSESVTCAVPFEEGKLLVGTGSAGLRTFDGKKFEPFGPSGWPSEGHRITDLCPVGGGLFAAAVDTVGIVFFDRGGHTVQVLERSLDHRLSRIRRMLYTKNGVLWALLNDGVARVEFPSPVSHFEPLVVGGLEYAQPLRHDGELWILTDGRAMHAVYDHFGRLDHFVDETPPGRYLFTLTDVEGRLFAGNDVGISVYEDGGWKLVLPGIVNARIGVAPAAPDGGIYYVADGECGIIEREGSSFTVRRFPAPNLADSYNSVIDSTGTGWLELGLSKVGRFIPNGGKPTIEILGAENGLPGGWVETYILDGRVRFHMGWDLQRYDTESHRFQRDTELLAKIPQLAVAGGRPATDALGRLWYTANGAVQMLDRRKAGSQPVTMAWVGFAPTDYTVEDDGIVWMFERRRLARLDTNVPIRVRTPATALITSVELAGSNRQIFGSEESIPSLKYSDNTLVFHYSAPADPFASPISFEVELEGSDNHWVSTGGIGTASFYRLKEGRYVFHVRPVTAAGPGGEDILRFAVLPPWYRTKLAWVIYILSAVGLFAFVTWLTSYLQRKENERLERVVTKRTAELNATNAQLGRQINETTEKSAALAASEERYRSLNAMLEERVRTRTAQVSQSNEELQRRESLFRLIFEHAPVGISWMRVDLGEIYHLNPTFSRILEFPASTLKDNSHLTSLVHPADLKRHNEMSGKVAGGDIDSFSLEERFVLSGDRVVWTMFSVAVVRDENKRIIQEIGILEDISLRKKAEEELAVTHKNLLDSSRQAGMAEVATGVLHNVGNVLNSVNVSATLVGDAIRHSKALNVVKLSALFEQNKSDLSGFLSKDPRGKLIPEYLSTLSESLGEEHKSTIAELENLRKNIEHIKEIVSMQQSYARTSGVIETLSVPDMIEDTLRIHAGGLARHDIETFRDYQTRPVITTDKHKVMQILINLVRNAKYACDESGRTDKRITVRTTSDDRGVRIAIIDNGVGIKPENITRIFNHGFTTRANGHGFGLHSGALAAKELGGSLNAESAGPNQGATFILDLPFKPATQPNEPGDS